MERPRYVVERPRTVVERLKKAWTGAPQEPAKLAVQGRDGRSSISAHMSQGAKSDAMRGVVNPNSHHMRFENRPKPGLTNLGS